jgi:DNA-binding response OmpR family regulator
LLESPGERPEERTCGARSSSALARRAGLDRLQRGADSVALEPRAMDLLVCLARHAGETVSKETLRRGLEGRLSSKE